MTLKTYQAPSMAEALAEVKRDLGRDAVILQTRNFRKGGLLGFWGRLVWEVTASPNLNVPRRITEDRYVSDRPAGPADTAPPAKAPAAVGPPAPPAPPEGDDRPPRPMANKLNDIHRMVEALLSRSPGDRVPAAVPPELHAHHAHLLGQDVPEQTASELLQELSGQLTGQQLADAELTREALRKAIAGRIRVLDEPPAPAGRARVIALIGPTGVGKTTTVAKLAANCKLREGKKVGLLTIDTYRIAAVDQLRTYADIIEVPLQAVLTTGEMHQAVQAMSDRDVILIDTAGRSPNNRLRLSQLRSFLAAARPDEVHLVISATGNRPCTREVLERFLPLGVNRVIVTKLDEAATFGVLLNVSTDADRPLSYVTTGQGVPEDILAADRESLAECILSGRFGEDVHAD